MRICTLAVLALVGLSVAAHAEPGSYLCISDLSTGFRPEGKEWRVAKFKVENERFIVKAVPEYEWQPNKVNYEVTQFGDKSPLHRCHRASTAEQMTCGGLGLGFMMNFRTLRFQEFYGHGFLSGKDDGKNTPYLTIGKCAPL
jgi:hypothetical protein